MAISDIIQTGGETIAGLIAKWKVPDAFIATWGGK